MTAKYGLPDHLIDLVGAAVQHVAVHIIENDPELTNLAWDWSDRVAEGDHEGLLNPEDAGSLLRLLKEVAEYVYTNPSNYTVDVAFAVHSEEILSFLHDVAEPVSVAA